MSKTLSAAMRRAGGFIDQLSLKMMVGAAARRGPGRAPPPDARERMLALAAHYREADLFGPPARTAVSVQERGKRRGSRIRDLEFPTPYRPTRDDYVEEFASYRENLIARARWFTGGGPRPTAILVHGWGAGQYLLEEHFFPLHALRRAGIDAVLYQLPFHAQRAPIQAPRSGALFPGPHLIRTNETFGQIIAELRTLAAWLRAEGAPAVGAIGMSLGGYSSALWAGLDDDLDFCVAMIPAADLAGLMWQHGRDARNRWKQRKNGVTAELLADVFAPHAPLERPVKLPRERLMVIAGESDQVAPPEQAKALWEHWNHPRIHWFPGGHLAQIGRQSAFRSLRHHLRDLGLTEER